MRRATGDGHFSSSSNPSNLVTGVFAKYHNCDSIPLGAFAFVLLSAFMPKRLKNEPAASQTAMSLRQHLAPETLKRIDFLGAFLLLGACLLVATALQQATAGKPFTAPDVLPLLIFSALFSITFVLWQWYATKKLGALEPVLPWRLMSNRVFLGMIL